MNSQRHCTRQARYGINLKVNWEIRIKLFVYSSHVFYLYAMKTLLLLLSEELIICPSELARAKYVLITPWVTSSVFICKLWGVKEHFLGACGLEVSSVKISCRFTDVIACLQLHWSMCVRQCSPNMPWSIVGKILTTDAPLLNLGWGEDLGCLFQSSKSEYIFPGLPTLTQWPLRDLNVFLKM